jgi:hypothetical protein
MKTKYLYIVIASLAFAGIVFSALKIERKYKHFSSQLSVKEGENESEETGIMGAMEWWKQRIADPVTGTVDPEDILKAEEQVLALKKFKNTNDNDMTWIEMGPDNVGGRTRALLIDKDNHNIMYAGGVSGGLWRSTTGGLSWNKVPYSGDTYDPFQNLCVTSICQAANGDIYFGTGEVVNTWPYPVEPFNGKGIWKSTKTTDPDHNNFIRLISTENSTFYYVNRLAADPVNSQRIYAATNEGLQVSSDGGASWSMASGTITQQSTDVKVGSDGTVICDINDRTYISRDGGATFVKNYTLWPNSVGGRLEFAISPTNSSYMYCQAAQPDGTLKNIYQSVDTGKTWTVILQGVGPNGEYSDFNPVGTQGLYDNVIAVFPDDPEKIFIGGQTRMWTWSESMGKEMVTLDYEFSQYFYVHPDHHVIVFHPEYLANHTVYIGTDGGIYRSTDGTYSFSNLNRNYNTVQFYTVGFDGKGHVVGGTQDNGTQYFGFTGNTLLNATHIRGGDGGYCDMSVLDPDVTFATVYYGSLKRSEEKGINFEDPNNPVGKYFFNDDILMLYWDGSTSNIGSTSYWNAASFVTPIRLWESYYDVLSTDSVAFINTVPNMILSDWIEYYNDLQLHYPEIGWVPDYENYDLVIDTTMVMNANGEFVVSTNLSYCVGSAILAESEIDERIIPYVVTEVLMPGDTIKVQDVYQAMLAIGFNGNVWLTRKPLNFKLQNSSFPWYPIVPPGMGIGTVQTLEFTKDGNYLFFSVNNHLYRASNLLYARTDSTMASFFGHDVNNLNPDQVIDVKLIKTFSNFITGIASDPNNPDKLVVTLGQYGSSNVMYSIDAAISDNPDFDSKHGNLPAMPVFTAIIGWDDSKRVIVGTRYGVYLTNDITPTYPLWVDENINGMQNVQVAQLRQQLFSNNGVSGEQGIINHGYVYAATHGRGMYRSETFKGPPLGIDETPAAAPKPLLVVYPNPANDVARIDYKLIKKSDVNINIYDLQGRLVKNIKLQSQKAGRQNFNIEVGELAKGTYILSICTSYDKASSKFLKQ